MGHYNFSIEALLPSIKMINLMNLTPQGVMLSLNHLIKPVKTEDTDGVAAADRKSKLFQGLKTWHPLDMVVSCYKKLL